MDSTRSDVVELDDPAIIERHVRAHAGLHIYELGDGVAALGNVTTDPRCRGRGLARRAVAQLCLNLRERCSIIGLNVHADNAAALACYRGLGFVELARYDEFMLVVPTIEAGSLALAFSQFASRTDLKSVPGFARGLESRIGLQTWSTRDPRARSRWPRDPRTTAARSGRS